MKEVTIYSTPTCVYCNMAKSYFTANKVKYTEHNVASDIEKRKEIEEAIKRIPPGKIMVDEQTGETLCGAPKTSTTSPIVRLAQ